MVFTLAKVIGNILKPYLPGNRCSLILNNIFTFNPIGQDL